MAAIHGASLSSQLSGTSGTIEGQSALMSFSGGVLIIVGARLAEGCTRYLFYCFHDLQKSQ